uniref:F-box domain-containing protein n=1 Tax=Picea sitchensis TaxID=3332 RepID=B8LMU8_PICSI|nr:unknown [Picea sitchensis]
MAWTKIRLNNNKAIMINQAACDSRTNDDDDGMDSINDEEVNLWSGLPEDLMDRIFSCLPLTSILHLRCVCKRWNSLVQSKRFQTALARVSSPRPWFILCTMGRTSCCYDPSTNKWHIIIRGPNSGRSILSPCISILAVSGSFLCLGNQVSECKVLSICNPITKSQRNLPRMLQVSLIHKVTMITYPESNKKWYKIMVSGESGLPTMRSDPYSYELLTELYDSSTDSWKMCGRPLPEAKFGSDPGVWCNDHLYYCITELPYGVVVFDLKTESWVELRVQMPSSLSSPSLVECRGRLLMIGRLSNMDQISPAADQTESNIPRIIIWELDVRHKEWVEIVRVPTEICRDFSVPLEIYAPFVCSGLGNHIYITTHRNPNVLVYDLWKNTWQWLPSDPFFPRRRDFHLLGFALEPRLDHCP